MAAGLRIEIGAPARGWAVVRLIAPGVELEFTASHTPRDSISDLASAAAQSQAGVPEQVVVWNTEPVEYEFRFITSAGRTRLEVYRFPDHRRHRRGIKDAIVEAEGDPSAIALAAWRGLRQLQGSMSIDEFAVGWGHAFPASTVKRLGESLRDAVSYKPPDLGKYSV